MPPKGGDVIGGAGVAFERLGDAKRHDRRRQVVVPRAGVGVQLLVGQRVILAQVQARRGAEKGDAVDLAAGGGDVFIEPPAQPAEEIQLPLARVVVVGRIGAAKRIIAGAVEHGACQIDAIGVAAKIGGVKVDRVGQHRKAPFLAVKGQHFPQVAMFAKRVEQVFRVEAVVKPCARRRGGDEGVDGLGQGVGAVHRPREAVHLRGQILWQHQRLGGIDDEALKPRPQVMAQGAFHLDQILDKHDGHRPFGKGLPPGREKCALR